MLTQTTVSKLGLGIPLASLKKENIDEMAASDSVETHVRK